MQCLRWTTQNYLAVSKNAGTHRKVLLKLLELAKASFAKSYQASTHLSKQKFGKSVTYLTLRRKKLAPIFSRPEVDVSQLLKRSSLPRQFTTGREGRQFPLTTTHTTSKGEPL